MATTVHNPVRGMTVYRMRMAQIPGMVMDSRVEQGAPFNTVKVHVLWLNGEDSWIDAQLLRDFDALITDTERKLHIHTAARERLKTL